MSFCRIIFIKFVYFVVVEMDAQLNVEEKGKNLMSEDDETADDVQNDQTEKQNA